MSAPNIHSWQALQDQLAAELAQVNREIQQNETGIEKAYGEKEALKAMEAKLKKVKIEDGENSAEEMEVEEDGSEEEASEEEASEEEEEEGEEEPEAADNGDDGDDATTVNGGATQGWSGQQEQRQAELVQLAEQTMAAVEAGQYEVVLDMALALARNVFWAVALDSKVLQAHNAMLGSHMERYKLRMREYNVPRQDLDAAWNVNDEDASTTAATATDADADASEEGED